MNVANEEVQHLATEFSIKIEKEQETLEKKKKRIIRKERIKLSKRQKRSMCPKPRWKRKR
eukprot:14750948-Ditylum_brightwellii.AAC.1